MVKCKCFSNNVGTAALDCFECIKLSVMKRMVLVKRLFTVRPFGDTDHRFHSDLKTFWGNFTSSGQCPD